MPPVKQPDEGVTYAHKIEKAEARVDWSQPAAVISRRIRAFDPFPGAFTELDGETFKLWRHELLSLTGTQATPAGTVLSADSTGIAVACGDGVLKLTELQRAGGKRLAVADFLRGFDIKPGMAFH